VETTSKQATSDKRSRLAKAAQRAIDLDKAIKRFRKYFLLGWVPGTEIEVDIVQGPERYRVSARVSELQYVAGEFPGTGLLVDLTPEQIERLQIPSVLLLNGNQYCVQWQQIEEANGSQVDDFTVVRI
jgi:hypothetical protein